MNIEKGFYMLYLRLTNQRQMKNFQNFLSVTTRSEASSGYTNCFMSLFVQ